MDEVKKILNSYLVAKREKDRLLRLLYEIEEKIKSINVDYTREKVLSTPEPDKLAESIDKLIRIRAACIEKSNLEIDAMRRVLDLINSITDQKARDVLTRRYIEGHQWEQIAYEMHYSWRGIHNLHNHALGLCKKCIEVHTKSVI